MEQFVSTTMKELNNKIIQNVGNIKKTRAFLYYMSPGSPTFFNAYRSLILAGYAPSYARSYSSKVFDMPRFMEVLAKAFAEREKQGK